MYYHGDFRSNDTTNDPKGQRYRVVIFTDYDGTNPYRTIEIENPPYAPIVYPDAGTTLEMATSPFVLNVEGDAENIYRAYRCSTAEISFRQDTIHPDMLSANGRSTLVVLLKWKNEVQEIGDTLHNTQTGEHLNKVVVQDGGFTYYNDYAPAAYDKFCYTVEWVGYASPECFSMDYSHNYDTFTLNAQDALSTLRYRKSTADPATNTLTSANAQILAILQGLTGYRKVYITDTIKYTTGEDVTAAILTQSHNAIDESGDPINQLEELSRILTYLGLSAVPHKDTLILTTPDAITNGWGNYYVYALPTTGYILNWLKDGADYTEQPTEQLTDTLTLNADCFAGNTSISTTNIYSKVSMAVDNYEVGEILPDITDENKYPAPDNMTVDYYSDTTSTDTTAFYAWERKAVEIPADSRVTVKHWQPDTFGGVWSNNELTDTPSIADYDKAGCFIIEHGGVVATDEANTLPLNSQYGRDYYFHCGRLSGGTFAGQNRQSYLDDKAQAWQSHLVFNSNNVLFSGGDYLNISGEWLFFDNRDKTKLQPKSLGSYSDATTARRTGALNTYYNYIWVKVGVAGWWLTNDGETYTWTDAETPCKLYLDWKEGQPAFDTPYGIKQTHRNIAGTCIPLPVSGDNVLFGNIHIEIDRPLGVYRYACECALLKDWSVRVIKIDDTTHQNTEYSTTIDDAAVSDYSIDGSIGSEHTNGALWSQAVKGSNGAYYQIAPIYNVATGKYQLFEAHATTNTANQYSTPTVSLQTTIHTTLKPYTIVTWSQLQNKKFMVDALQRDYERNTDTVSVVEVKTPQPQATSRRNITRNYRRNGDLITNALSARTNAATLTPSAAGTITAFTLSDGTLNVTSGELEGNITLQPSFHDGTLQVSVPDGVDGNFTMTDGVLQFTN